MLKYKQKEKNIRKKRRKIKNKSKEILNKWSLGKKMIAAYKVFPRKSNMER